MRTERGWPGRVNVQALVVVGKGAASWEGGVRGRMVGTRPGEVVMAG